jgi:hypothetical protein
MCISRACSQKLAAWQENAELGLEKLKLTRAHTAREPRKGKQSTKTKEIKAEMKTLTLNVENTTTNNTTTTTSGLKVRRKSK